MSVTAADIGGSVPEPWIDAVNERLNALHHEDLCNCRDWPTSCASGYIPGQWDETTAARVAAVVLEPLICDKIALEKQKPNKAMVTRQLKAAGYRVWDGRNARTVPGFKVSFNRSITPDGVAVIHMGQFDDPVAMEAALASYARTLSAMGYDARVEIFADTLKCVRVRRPPRTPAVPKSSNLRAVEDRDSLRRRLAAAFIEAATDFGHDDTIAARIEPMVDAALAVLTGGDVMRDAPAAAG